MRVTLTAVAVAAACASLCGACASGATNTQLMSALGEIAKDPNCGHTDRVDIDLNMTGPTGKLFLERQCAAKGAAAPAGNSTAP